MSKNLAVVENEDQIAEESKNESNQAIDQLETLGRFSFIDLANKKQEIVRELCERDGELSEETEQVMDMVNALIEGKADRVAVLLKEVLPAHIDALKMQIKTLEKIQSRVENIAFQAVLANNNQPIEGLAYRLGLRVCPESVDITDESKVPKMFKFRRFELKIDVPAHMEDEIQDWEELIRSREKDYTISIKESDIVDKNTVKEILKNGQSIEGLALIQNLKLKIDAGKVKPSKVAGKKKLKLIKE